jgi:hypothetical protein
MTPHSLMGLILYNNSLLTAQTASDTRSQKNQNILQIYDFSFRVGVVRLGFGEAEIPLTGSVDGFFCLRRHRVIPDEEGAGV